MKKIPPLAGIAMLLAVSLAHAQATVNEPNALGLGWHGCSTQNPLGAANVQFACEAEAFNACRVFRLMPTFVSSISDTGFAGSEVALDVWIGTSPTVGQWWAGMASGGCRGVEALTLAVYTDAPSLPTPGACHKLYPSGSSTLAGQRNHPTGQPNRIRITSVKSVYPYATLTAGQRTYADQFELKTEGTLADCDPTVDSAPICTDGCSTPACIVLTNVTIYMEVKDGNSNPDIIHYSHDGGASRNWVTYQGGACTSLGITPTRNTTWGAIKSLYR